MILLNQRAPRGSAKSCWATDRFECGASNGPKLGPPEAARFIWQTDVRAGSFTVRFRGRKRHLVQGRFPGLKKINRWRVWDICLQLIHEATEPFLTALAGDSP